jgi:hypothetical protein
MYAQKVAYSSWELLNHRLFSLISQRTLNEHAGK